MAVRVAGASNSKALAEACNLKLENLLSFQIVADAKGMKTVLLGCQDD